MVLVFFFLNDTATTDIYTLSLHDALPISTSFGMSMAASAIQRVRPDCFRASHKRRRIEARCGRWRSEEHTSELQSRQYLVCRLLLAKKQIYSSLRSQANTSHLHPRKYVVC